PFVTRTGPSPDRRLQSGAIPHRPYEPGGCHPSLFGSECPLDDPHALRNLPLIARAHRRTSPVAGAGSAEGRGEQQSGGPRRRHYAFLLITATQLPAAAPGSAAFPTSSGREYSFRHG